MGLQRSEAKLDTTQFEEEHYLSAAWLSKNPGLDGVVKAMKIYQDEMRDKVAPKCAYKGTEWLRTLESLD